MANSKNGFNLLRRGAVILALILSITSIATQGSRAPATSSQAKTHVYVSVSPATASVEVGSSRSFAATVHNDSPGKGVKWTLSGAGKLSATFSKSSQAVEYTAPSSVPSPATVTLTATSVANSAKSASVTIAVKPVPPPTPVDLGDLQDPQVTVDVHSHIDIAALSAGRSGVVFRHSADGGRTFSSTTVVTSPRPLAGLQMALDAQGHITLLWEDWQFQQAFVSVSSDGVAFSTPARVPGAGINCGLGPCPTDRGIYPDLSVTPSGAINVASIGTVGDPNVDVISTRSVDGGAHFSAGVDIAFAATSVTSAAGPQGQDYLIWSSPDGTINLSASLDGGKSFGSVVTVADTFASNLYAVVDSFGDIDVTWRRGTAMSTNNTNALMLSRSTDQGQTFSTPIAVFTTTEFVIPDHQQLAAEKDGAIDVVASGDAGGNEGTILFASSVDHGASFSSQTLNKDGGFPTMGIDSCGGVNVAWDSGLVLGKNDIFLTRSTDATPFSTPANLSNNHANHTSFVPQIATDSRGHTYVVWAESFPNGSTNVFFLIAAHLGTTCKQAE
jgi:hypothetical protein